MFYKITDVQENKVLLRYGRACDVIEITGIHRSNVKLSADEGLYKGRYKIESDYESALCEEWDRVCCKLLGIPMRSPRCESGRGGAKKC